MGLRHFLLKIQTIIRLTDGQNRPRYFSQPSQLHRGRPRAAPRDYRDDNQSPAEGDTTIEPEAIEAMGRAYADLLADLKLADRNDAFTEILAKEIVKTASRGVRSATDIRANVLATLGKSAGV